MSRAMRPSRSGATSARQSHGLLRPVFCYPHFGVDMSRSSGLMVCWERMCWLIHGEGHLYPNTHPNPPAWQPKTRGQPLSNLDIFFQHPCIERGFQDMVQDLSRLRATRAFAWYAPLPAVAWPRAGRRVRCQESGHRMQAARPPHAVGWLLQG